MQIPGFWAELKKPIIGLSPMDGVTDQPYRFIQKKYGNPDVVYTEFATVEGFCRGAEKVLSDFLYDESQRPIVAQIYGTTPKFFSETSTALCELGFDGIDINMGCPAKSVAQSGAGAALILTPALAKKIVKAVKKGVENWQNGKTSQDCPNITDPLRHEIKARFAKLPAKYQRHDRPIPVTVKTRVGFDAKVAKDWIKTLLEVEPVAIAIHGRTLRQGYSGKADWQEIGYAVKEARNTNTLIIGNGDVQSRSQALERVKQFGVDGVFIGRATFGNPWVFRDQEVDIYTRAKVAAEHSRLFEETYQKRPNYHFLPMRKHLAWYIKGVDNASEIRQQLMQAEGAGQVEAILKNHQLLV
ncbi:MAG TPA: tRNA-dihydrouridine synthase [Patescibacteria group bacterium]|jgi:nifR3 family TIM-barrel protein